MFLIVASIILSVLTILLGGTFLFNKLTWWFGLLCIAHGVLFLIIALGVRSDMSYKQGQIDAANGKQKYQLTTQPDNTTKWELKDKK